MKAFLVKIAIFILGMGVGAAAASGIMIAAGKES